MTKLSEAASDFLALKRIAVAGVSGTSNKTGNYIYDKFKKNGYEVFPVNPNATDINGDRCYPNLAAIDGGVDGVVIVTKASVTEKIVEECASLGIRHVWIHKSVDKSSYSDKAVAFCRENDIEIIPAACPMMFLQPVDFAHKCMKWIFTFSGKIPKQI